MIRVATLNTRHGTDAAGRPALEEQADLLHSSIGDTGPRIVLLQECDRGMSRSGGIDQPARVAELLGLPTVVFGSNLRRDGGQYGTAVLCDIAVRGVEHLLLESNSDGHVTHLDGTVHGQEQRGLLLVRFPGDLLVVNVHASVWPAERRAMRDELSTIARYHHGPLVIGGDFNSDDPAEGLLIDGLVDAAGADTGPTFPAGHPIARIDRVLVRGAQVDRYRNIVTESSDHHLVSVDLEPPARTVPYRPE